jgi:hypothetical protein
MAWHFARHGYRAEAERAHARIAVLVARGQG